MNIPSDGYLMDLSRCWFYTGSFSNVTENVTADYNFFIDWGDGSPTEHYTKQQAVNSYIPVSHRYEKKGVHVITLTGTCDNLYLEWNTSDSYKNGPMGSIKTCLWGIRVPKNCQSPLKYAYRSFFGCENLHYLGKNVFANATDCKTISHLFDGASIEYFYEYSLYGMTKLVEADYGFEACKMKGIHPNLFKWSPKLKTLFHAFHRCDKLLSIPQGLLDNNPELTNVSWCFKACTSITTVPSTLFDKNLNINNCSYCFAGGRIDNGDISYNAEMAITYLPPLWERQKSMTKNKYATGCVNASNYMQAVINGWA